MKEAAALYVRHVFFRPDATPYQILGLRPGASAPAIKERFRLLMHLVHPDRQDSDDAWPESFAALANGAYGVLRDQEARAAYDRDADARAALARAVNRAAVAAEASLMPVVMRTARPGGEFQLARPVLPEWLTAGVGGYVRAHPAITAFGVLIAGATLVVLMSVRDGPEELLAREVREGLAPTALELSETARATRDPALPVASAAPLVARSGSVSAEHADRRTEPEMRADDASPAPEGARALSGIGTADNAAGRTSGTPLAAESTVVVAAAAIQEPAVAIREPVVAQFRPGLRDVPPARAAVPSLRVEPPAAAPPLVAPTSPPASPDLPPVAQAPPPSMPALAPITPALPPASPEIEALFAEFVDTYEHGRLDAFAALFDDDADTNLRHGRAAIRNEYDELFRLSSWRRMQLTRINWRRAGDKAYAKGEIAVRIGWRDGREVEQRINVEMELVRRDGRAVIARLSHQPKDP